MNRMDRRRFLLALGAGAALDFNRSAAARADVRPLRFIGVYTPHGRAHEHWRPGDGFALGGADCVLQPFDDAARFGKSFRDRLLVLDGIDLAAGIEVGTTGHDGPRVILTGSGANGRNASIDQFLAVEQGLGDDTPHASVALGVGNDQSDIGSNISYASGGTPIPKCIDPAQTFADLFGSALGGARKEDIERDRRLGQSVLDGVRDDLRRLRERAPASERTKLEQHQTALREIEKRLSAVERHCEAPPAPAGFPKLRAYGGGERYFDAVTDLQIDLLARSLACDLTRFATLFLADLTRTKIIAELPDDVHGDVAHRYDAHTDKHPGTPQSWHLLALQNRYSYGKVARLLQRLDEADILDDTIVYISGDMGDPARHSSRSVPTLIAGGGGKLKMGRYLDFRGAGSSGIPNNRVLVSICQAFGVAVDRFGHATDSAIVTGALTV